MVKPGIASTPSTPMLPACSMISLTSSFPMEEEPHIFIIKPFAFLTSALSKNGLFSALSTASFALLAPLPCP